MSDRNDPKAALWSGEDRRGADKRPRSGGTEDDPLAELAKAVQGRPGSASRSRSEPAKPAVQDDLEAELMNDLQASFAAVRDFMSAPPAEPAPQPQPAPQPAPQAQKPQPQPAPPSQPPAQRAEPPPRPEPRIEPTVERAPDPPRRAAPPPPPPQMAQPSEPPAPRAETRRNAANDEAFGEEIPRFFTATAPQRQEPAPPAAEAPRSYPTRAPRADFNMTTRASAAQAAPPQQAAASQAPKTPRSRWEKPEFPRQPSGASSFAPRTGKGGGRGQVPPLTDDDLDPFGYDDEGGEGATADTFPLDAFSEAPDFDDALPPFEDDDLPAMAPRKSGRAVFAIVGVVAIGIIGAAAFFVLRPGGTTGTGEPPVIAANGEPTKITPADTTTADNDPQNKLIYDRVATDSGADAAGATLVTPGTPSDTSAAADDANNPIARIILPGGPTDTGAGNETAMADTMDTSGPDSGAMSAADEEGIGPKKVRTVVVKPDGTIVSSGAVSAGEAAPAEAMTPVSPNPPADEPQQTAAVEPLPPASPPTNDTAAIAGTDELVVTPDPSVTDTAPADATPAPKAPAPAPKQVATTKVEPGPIDITPATAAAKPAAPASGGMLVQVSSQRSEDAARATYRDLQARYPKILGQFDANIQRAEIPNRGTFFRVRIGPFSSRDAQALCDDLKSAGGDCILAPR